MSISYQYVTSTTGDANTATPVSASTTPPPINVLFELQQLDKQSKEIQMYQGQLLEKALSSNDPDIALSANKYWQDVQERHSSGMKSHVEDPNDWSNGAGYKLKKFALTHSTLRRMASTPVIRAIIGTRQTQVSAFSSPQRNKYDTGFVVRKKRDFYVDDEPELSSADKVKIKEITAFLINGGTQGNAWNGDTFDTFLKKLVNDSLTLDQGCFEVARDRRGRPGEYRAVDGATIRLADTHNSDETYDADKEASRVKGYLPTYVQLIDGQIKAEYFPWELCFGVRNATTDINSNGYGTSEIEELISIITWMLYSDAYNGKFFSQGSNPKGMLKVAPGVNRNRIAEFRQQWMSMVAGVQNAWKIPIIESDKMEWIDLQKNNTDMQFAQWQEYLIKISCAIFKIAPEEVGFELGSAGSGSPLFDSGNEAKLKYSRDKGLKPLLKSIEFWINKWIVNALDQGFEFMFVGYDTESEEKELELDIKRAGSFWGFKEIRRKNNMPEDLESDDFVLNPTYLQMMNMQAYSQDQQQSTQAVDEEQDTWDNLGEEVAKSIINSTPMLSGHKDNPMMQDALQFLIQN